MGLFFEVEENEWVVCVSCNFEFEMGKLVIDVGGFFGVDVDLN